MDYMMSNLLRTFSLNIIIDHLHFLESVHLCHMSCLRQFSDLKHFRKFRYPVNHLTGVLLSVLAKCKEPRRRGPGNIELGHCSESIVIWVNSGTLMWTV